jgi:hypothetical protein
LHRLDPSSDPILRVSSLLRFESDGRRASAMVDVLNTVRTIRMQQAHDATWEHCLSVPGATPEVVLVHFWPTFGPDFPRMHPSVRPIFNNHQPQLIITPPTPSSTQAPATPRWCSRPAWMNDADHS